MFRVKNIAKIKTGDLIKHPVYFYSFKELCFVIKIVYSVDVYIMTYIDDNKIYTYVLHPKHKIRVLV